MMIVIKVNRKIMWLSLCCLLAISLCLNFLITAKYNKRINALEILITHTNAFYGNKVCTFALNSSDFLSVNSYMDTRENNDHSVKDYPEHHQNIEIFDIGKGEVVKNLPNSEVMQKRAESYLNGITGMYAKANAIPVKGYVVRMPLKAGITVKNKWLDSTVYEIFVFFPANEKPFMLVLDNERRPLFYEFKGNTDTLLLNLGIPADEQTQSMSSQ